MALSATTVCLVRHGSVVGAETRRFIGHLDVPLSPLGVAQVDALSRRLSGVAFDAIYCSDLDRTRHSAEILAAPHALTPIRDAALREFAMGEWDGLTAEQIRARDARAFEAWMADAGRFQFPGARACRIWWHALSPRSTPWCSGTRAGRSRWWRTAGAIARSSATPSGSVPSGCSRWARTTRRSPSSSGRVGAGRCAC